MTTSPTGQPTWIDLTAPDISATRGFYGNLFGWTYSEPSEDYGNYANALLDGKAVAGVSPTMEGWPPSTAWTVYLQTDDITLTDAKVTSSGGARVMEPMEVGPFGWMGLWTDPTGCLFGAWQAKEHPGFEVMGTSGSVNWVDLATTDVQAAKDFYEIVFGWTYASFIDDGDTQYWMFTPAGADQPAGGIGNADRNGDLPTGWNTCFGVADLEDAIHTVERNGGSTIGEVMTFEYGRIATVRDQAGVIFSVIEPQAEAG